MVAEGGGGVPTANNESPARAVDAMSVGGQTPLRSGAAGRPLHPTGGRPAANPGVPGGPTGYNRIARRSIDPIRRGTGADMTSRVYLWAVAALAVATPVGAAAPRPNVVLVLAD